MLATVKHQKEFAANSNPDVKTLAGLVLQCGGDKSNDKFIEAQICPPITLKVFKKILHNPDVARPIRAKGLVGKSAKLSRRLLADYLKSLEGEIEVEITSGQP